MRGEACDNNVESILASGVWLQQWLNEAWLALGLAVAQRLSQNINILEAYADTTQPRSSKRVCCRLASADPNDRVVAAIWGSGADRFNTARKFSFSTRIETPDAPTCTQL